MMQAEHCLGTKIIDNTNSNRQPTIIQADMLWSDTN